MKRKMFVPVLILLLIIVAFCGCQGGKISDQTEPSTTKSAQTETATEVQTTKQTETQLPSTEISRIVEKHRGQAPSKWSEKLDGVVDTFKTDKKAIALTFDACGGPNGSGFDKELIDFLVSEKISATLFVNKRWIENNKGVFLELANNPLFEIENHGFEHRPLSVDSKEIYGINGTGSPERVVDEIKMNEDLIFELTGKRTKFFRSGTAYYDDVAVSIARDMGYKIAGFQINGDGGATFTVQQIGTAMSKAKSGDIVISHFNQPNKNTYEGIQEPILNLKAEGYNFLKLEEAIK